MYRFRKEVGQDEMTSDISPRTAFSICFGMALLFFVLFLATSPDSPKTVEVVKKTVEIIKTKTFRDGDFFITIYQDGSAVGGTAEYSVPFMIHKVGGGNITIYWEGLKHYIYRFRTGDFEMPSFDIELNRLDATNLKETTALFTNWEK